MRSETATLRTGVAQQSSLVALGSSMMHKRSRQSFWAYQARASCRL